MPAKQSAATRRAIDGGEKLGTSGPRGTRTTGTRRAIMRRDLSGTLERGAARQREIIEKKRRKKADVDGGQTPTGEPERYRIRADERIGPRGKTVENWPVRVSR